MSEPTENPFGDPKATHSYELSCQYWHDCTNFKHTEVGPESMAQLKELTTFAARAAGWRVAYSPTTMKGWCPATPDTHPEMLIAELRSIADGAQRGIDAGRSDAAQLLTAKATALAALNSGNTIGAIEFALDRMIAQNG